MATSTPVSLPFFPSPVSPGGVAPTSTVSPLSNATSPSAPSALSARPSRPIMSDTDPLIKACKRGDASSVHSLVSHHDPTDVVDYVNSRDKNGSTPIFHTVWPGHLDALQALLAYGASPNIQNNKLNTALHLACEQQHHDIILLLISYDASIHLQNFAGLMCYEMIADKAERGKMENFVKKCWGDVRRGTFSSLQLKPEGGTIKEFQMDYYRRTFFDDPNNVERVKKELNTKRESLGKEKKGTLSMLTMALEEPHLYEDRQRHAKYKKKTSKRNGERSTEQKNSGDDDRSNDGDDEGECMVDDSDMDGVRHHDPMAFEVFLKPMLKEMSTGIAKHSRRASEPQFDFGSHRNNQDEFEISEDSHAFWSSEDEDGETEKERANRAERRQRRYSAYLKRVMESRQKREEIRNMLGLNGTVENDNEEKEKGKSLRAKQRERIHMMTVMKMDYTKVLKHLFADDGESNSTCSPTAIRAVSAAKERISSAASRTHQSAERTQRAPSAFGRSADDKSTPKRSHRRALTQSSLPLSPLEPILTSSKLATKARSPVLLPSSSTNSVDDVSLPPSLHHLSHLNVRKEKKEIRPVKLNEYSVRKEIEEVLNDED